MDIKNKVMGDNNELIDAVMRLKYCIKNYVPEQFREFYYGYIDKLIATAKYAIPQKVEIEYEPQTHDSPSYRSAPGCPTCGEELDEKEEPGYCPYCGQALIWSDDEEDYYG